jgi:hypothetical protein
MIWMPAFVVGVEGATGTVMTRSVYRMVGNHAIAGFRERITRLH